MSKIDEFIKYLQKRLIDLIMDRKLSSEAFAEINKIIAEWWKLEGEES